MTARERVKRCVDFDHPDRVPRDIWLLPIAWEQHGRGAVEAFLRRWPTDFGRPDVPNPKLQALVEGDPCAVGLHRDEWGCVFVNVQAGVIGQVKRPILDDWSRLEDLRPPLAALEFDIAEADRRCRASDRFILADCCPRPFERMQFLRGTERLLRDIARDPPELHALIELVHGFYCREVERWSRTAVDGIMFMDDWGSQRGLLISPTRWRQLFKPLYGDYARLAHAAGKKVFMHSDGCIFDIFDDLIEIGVDAINSQLFCMDLARIGQRFRGRISFWGEIDRQHVLPAENAEAARQAVRAVVEHLYDPAGGVIAQFELGGGARLANAEAVFQTWCELTGGSAADGPTATT